MLGGSEAGLHHTQAAASRGIAPIADAGPERADRLVVDTHGLPSAIRFDVWRAFWEPVLHVAAHMAGAEGFRGRARLLRVCLLYTSDAADE